MIEIQSPNESSAPPQWWGALFSGVLPPPPPEVPDEPRRRRWEPSGVPEWLLGAALLALAYDLTVSILEVARAARSAT